MRLGGYLGGYLGGHYGGTRIQTGHVSVCECEGGGGGGRGGCEILAEGTS